MKNKREKCKYFAVNFMARGGKRENRKEEREGSKGEWGAWGDLYNSYLECLNENF